VAAVAHLVLHPAAFPNKVVMVAIMPGLLVVSGPLQQVVVAVLVGIAMVKMGIPVLAVMVHRDLL
jgi:hypothetical protein